MQLVEFERLGSHVQHNSAVAHGFVTVWVHRDMTDNGKKKERGVLLYVRNSCAILGISMLRSVSIAKT